MYLLTHEITKSNIMSSNYCNFDIQTRMNNKYVDIFTTIMG